MGPSSSPYTTLILIAVMVAAFYFLIIRPNKKRVQTQQRTMSSLTPGTRVMLTSGVFGTLLEIGDKQALLEVSPGVELTVLKQAIARAAQPSDENTVSDFDDEDDSTDDDLVDAGSVDEPGAQTTVEATGPGAVAADSAGSHVAADTVSGPRAAAPDQGPYSGTSTTPIKD